MLNFIRTQIWIHLPKRVTRKQCVQAAIAWGIGLPAFFALIHWFRHRDEAEPSRLPLYVMLGGIALGLGLLTPRLGEAIYIGVLRFFSIIGWIVGTVGLTIMFYTVVTPMGFALRLGGKDAMDRKFKKDSPPRWHSHEGKRESRRYYRLF